MSQLPPIPLQFWTLLALCLLALLSLWWVLLGASRAARRRSLRARIAAVTPGGAAGLAPAEDAAIQQSLAQQVPPSRPASAGTPRRSTLYTTPWFLFVGDASANVTELLALATGRRSAKHAPPASRPFWRWHRLPSMIAIEVDPAVLGNAPDERGLWYRALLELAERRKRLPLNGIVVCVGAATLLEAGRARDELARRLRALVYDAAEHLRIQLPVYLVVTGLERLGGFDALRAALPAGVLEQALGHRLHNGAAPRVPAATQLDGLFSEIMQRMHALRMALFRAERSPAERHATHAFVEQLRSLQPGLRSTVDVLFGYGAGPRSPRWRGLYLAATPSDGSAGAFALDLFTRFLPSDQPLAHSRRPGAANDSDFASTRM
ncbi:ImcF-related N-terminal domain-containing protein [Variovorax sp. HW608]|uniref:type VI secretion system protein n=1 Tax=Variovorax sp. HW608 TaxID=1034889 RepID=UPI00081FC917|nr:type VI secretion system protein [Variovorax sp. HW608]SCK61361.1 ImcF-related N-terminal domain-containing protein [Variovorax sp. HW608]